MVDPATTVAALVKKGRVDAAWMATYDARRIATKEMSEVDAEEAKPAEKVVRIAAAKK